MSKQAVKREPLAPGFRLDPTLQKIKPDTLKSIFPDLSISAKADSCCRVTFTVTLSPGMFLASGNQAVKVRVMDKVFGALQTVGEALIFLPAKGGTVSGMIEWPMPDDAKFGPDFANEITVIVDPDKSIVERDETNNTVTTWGVCLG